MKKVLPIFMALSVIAFASCKKLTNSDNSYTCQCTYVASTGSPSSGQPNKVETTPIKDDDQSDAQIQCDGLNIKYETQYFTGTCLIQ